MPAVAYYSDEDTEAYTNLLFTELVHEQLVEKEGQDAIESDPNLEFMFVSLAPSSSISILIAFL